MDKSISNNIIDTSNNDISKDTLDMNFNCLFDYKNNLLSNIFIIIII
jgi:hypothetical protein